MNRFVTSLVGIAAATAAFGTAYACDLASSERPLAPATTPPPQSAPVPPTPAEQQKNREDQKKEANSRFLLEAYTRYIIVKVCNEQRQGYLVNWINNAELDRARTTTKNIELDALDRDPDLDSAAIWSTANSDARGTRLYRDSCQLGFQNLEQQGYDVRLDVIKKDF